MALRQLLPDPNSKPEDFIKVIRWPNDMICPCACAYLAHAPVRMREQIEKLAKEMNKKFEREWEKKQPPGTEKFTMTFNIPET
jgi:hypothetical protein